jgi:hypothetical protein
MFYFVVYKTPSLASVLGHMDPVHLFPPYLFKTHLTSSSDLPFGLNILFTKLPTHFDDD